jgi:hypothetical protein
MLWALYIWLRIRLQRWLTENILALVNILISITDHHVWSNTPIIVSVYSSRSFVSWLILLRLLNVITILFGSLLKALKVSASAKFRLEFKWRNRDLWRELRLAGRWWNWFWVYVDIHRQDSLEDLWAVLLVVWRSWIVWLVIQVLWQFWIHFLLHLSLVVCVRWSYLLLLWIVG